MSKKLEFKVIVLEDGKEVLRKPLNYEAVAEIVSSLEDCSENEDFFNLAAEHPSYVVRLRVVNKDSLSSEAINILGSDNNKDVLCDLVSKYCFSESANLEQLKKMLLLDPAIALNIASNLGAYTVDTAQLALAIAQHDDPNVLRSLAENNETPKKILKELLKNADPSVVFAAQRSLENS